MTDNELIAENRRHYHRVHQWLHRNHGKASKCENDNCDGNSNDFEWALLKGKVYDKDVSNFIQLCVICHRRYDLDGKPAWNAGLRTGPQSAEHIYARSESLKGRTLSDKTKSKISTSHRGKKLSTEHKLKLSIAKYGNKNWRGKSNYS
jgi:hypothetical protein